MRFILYFSSIMFLFLTGSDTLDIEYNSINRTIEAESFAVTFKCDSCTERNKFFISGPEKHTFKAVNFPLKIKLKPGKYEMTYWQNRVQQIHLPFDVSADSENVIIVKD